MRIYKDFRESMSEIRRDLKEMGIKVRTKTYQDKDISGDPLMETLEIQNYVYTVLEPSPDDLDEAHRVWAENEFLERIDPRGLNPGTAWELRPEVWNQFIEPSGKFAYTYSERIHQVQQIQHIVGAIRRDRNSRQLYMSIWNPEDVYNLGIRRVPCTLGYYFQVRKNKLNITYLQRSADFVTHFWNDCYLATRMVENISYQTDLAVGTFTHWLGSLHVFNKDVEGIF